MAVQYLVPTETAGVLGNQYPLDCNHLGLILARYLPHEAIRNGKEDMILNQQGRPTETIRSDWLKKLVKRFQKEDNPALHELQKSLIKRWQEQVLATPSLIFEMRLRSRMVVGLGGKNALEFGITLHHTSGMPILPGSALKGAARNFALLTIAADPDYPNNAASLEELDAQLMSRDDMLHTDALIYRRAFGSQESAGECIFHDALVSRMPTTGSLYAVDVMTPHFVKYYTSSGGDAPDDGDNPNPISFLTVERGTTFGVAVSTRRGAPDEEAVRLRAAQWVVEALDMLGIGAKTVAGYGIFTLIEK